MLACIFFKRLNFCNSRFWLKEWIFQTRTPSTCETSARSGMDSRRIFSTKFKIIRRLWASRNYFRLDILCKLPYLKTGWIQFRHRLLDHLQARMQHEGAGPGGWVEGGEGHLGGRHLPHPRLALQSHAAEGIWNVSWDNTAKTHLLFMKWSFISDYHF